MALYNSQMNKYSVKTHAKSIKLFVHVNRIQKAKSKGHTENFQLYQ